jgi:hypothetical protein
LEWGPDHSVGGAKLANDVVGEHLIGDRKIVSEGVVIGGRWWHPSQSPKFKPARRRDRSGKLM